VSPFLVTSSSSMFADFVFKFWIILNGRLHTVVWIRTIFLSQLQKGLLHTESRNPETAKCFTSFSCAIVGFSVCRSPHPHPPHRVDRQAPAWRSIGITLYSKCREVEQSVKEVRKRFAAIITFRKSNKNFNSATAGAESFAHLTECTEYNCRRRCCLLSGVLLWK
jgi:hypothetical protein